MGLRPGSFVIGPGTLTSALSGIFHPALTRIGDFRRRLARALWPARPVRVARCFLVESRTAPSSSNAATNPKTILISVSGTLSVPDANRNAGLKKTVCSGSDNVDGPGRIVPFVNRPPGNLGPPYGVIRTGARCVVRDGPEGRKGGEIASGGDGFRGVFEGAENVLQRM